MSLKDKIGKELLFFDGAMGTMMQSAGLGPGQIPEYWVIEKPEVIKNIHRAYLDAGCDIILACTFGANPVKMGTGKYSTAEIAAAAVRLAREAVDESGREAFVALDSGSTGKLLEPLGELSFEEAVSAYKELFSAGRGADAVIIETMTDSYELKAAVLAAKEATDLPVFATVMLDEKGQLLTGGDVPSIVALLEGLGVDALGLNCGFGPSQMLPYVSRFISCSSLPVIVTPNAGLPRSVDGETVYDLDPCSFADEMEKIAALGPWLLGGCCGTTPEHMKEVTGRLKGFRPAPVVKKTSTIISSYTHAVEIGSPTTIIGEKINPTGNKALAAAIRSSDFDQITGLAVREKKAGAQVLDVNVGLPDADEPVMLPETVKRIQALVDLPLVIDCSNISAIEKAARVYNGKPLINSVNAKQSSLDSVLPVVAKYGCAVIGLTLGDDGIPKTPEGRLQLAEKIISEAAKYGIDKKNIIIDTLAMTVSADSSSARTTLQALEMISRDLGVSTVLGVSNISFGLPAREKANTAFYAMAIGRGLSAAIIDPFSQAMMGTCMASRALTSQDESCSGYIRFFEGQAAPAPEEQPASERGNDLFTAIVDGLKEETAEAARELLEANEPMVLINEYIIPALTDVGERFETGEYYLPQLIMSAEAAGLAFDEVKKKMPAGKREKKGTIILATVEGDIHDIGKNIVRVLLENYDYEILDLGRDVPADTILKAAVENNVRMIGLSALMTTSVPFMEKTINLLKKHLPDCSICVGGAVLTQEYSDTIGADHYCRDAMATVRCAEKFFS